MTASGPIAAVVVTYQSQSTIETCLRHLLQADDVSQIRVVDNGSTDGTLAVIQRIAASEGRVHFIGNPDNPGFSVACNQGAHDSDCPWLAFVNPDCYVAPDSLDRLRAHAEALGGYALLGADLVDENGINDAASRRRDLDFQQMLRSGAGSQQSIPRQDGSPVQVVDAVSGALMLLPRSLFDRIGGFDEGYRLHAEDLDLCRRVRLAGGTVATANDVRVVHLRGVSSRARPWFVEWHKHRGLARYFRKFEAPERGGLTRALVPALIWLRFVLVAVRLLAR